MGREVGEFVPGPLELDHAQTVNKIDGDLLEAGSLLSTLRIFEQASQSASIVSHLAFRYVRNSKYTSRSS